MSEKLLILLIIVSFFLIVLRPFIKQFIDGFGAGWKKKEKEQEEMTDYYNRLLFEHEQVEKNSVPDDETIEKYYQMYLLRNSMSDKWKTDMPKKEFLERAKKPATVVDLKENKFFVSGGWHFLLQMTCDLMVGIPPNVVYIRTYDYEYLLKKKAKEDETIIKE